MNKEEQIREKIGSKFFCLDRDLGVCFINKDGRYVVSLIDFLKYDIRFLENDENDENNEEE
jgi:hypothetical protein